MNRVSSQSRDNLLHTEMESENSEISLKSEIGDFVFRMKMRNTRWNFSAEEIKRTPNGKEFVRKKWNGTFFSGNLAQENEREREREMFVFFGSIRVGS